MHLGTRPEDVGTQIVKVDPKADLWLHIGHIVQIVHDQSDRGGRRADEANSIQSEWIRKEKDLLQDPRSKIWKEKILSLSLEDSLN